MLLPLTRHQSSHFSSYWRAGLDGKEESEGEPSSFLSFHQPLLPLPCDSRRRLGTSQQLPTLQTMLNNCKHFCALCMKIEIDAYRLIRTKKNRVAIKIKTDNPPPIPPASNSIGIPAKRERFSQEETRICLNRMQGNYLRNRINNFSRPSLLYSSQCLWRVCIKKSIVSMQY